MLNLFLILICLAIAVGGELFVARHRCRRPGRLPEDIQ